MDDIESDFFEYSDIPEEMQILIRKMQKVAKNEHLMIIYRNEAMHFSPSCRQVNYLYKKINSLFISKLISWMFSHQRFLN